MDDASSGIRDGDSLIERLKLGHDEKTSDFTMTHQGTNSVGFWRKDTEPCPPPQSMIDSEDGPSTPSIRPTNS